MSARGLVVGIAAGAFLFAGSGGPSSATSADHNDSLVGTWRLVTYMDTVEGEKPIYAFGTQPIGQFIFTSDGYISVSIMRSPPDIKTPTSDPDPDACIPGWYCSYFGTYTVDSKRSAWTTHVLGSNIPAYHGTNQSRPFTIRGDKLIISVDDVENGKRVHSERVLVRMRASGG